MKPRLNQRGFLLLVSFKDTKWNETKTFIKQLKCKNNIRKYEAIKQGYITCQQIGAMDLCC